MTELPEAGVIPELTLGWRMQLALGRRISVETIARELDVSRSTVSRWLNDRGAPPRALYLKEWALRTGVSYAWLAGDQFPRRRGVRKAPFKRPLLRLAVSPVPLAVTTATLGLAA